eukprot:Em0008g1148a
MSAVLEGTSSNNAEDDYGIQCDEVTDSSNWEQLGLVLRYVKGNKPVERLLEFIPCDCTTGEALCHNAIEALTGVGLDVKLCQSQTMDGAGNIHELNLALCKSCDVKEIHLMLDTVKQPRIDTYFSRVNDIIRKGKISSRIKFALQDVVDLRDNKWVPRQRQDTKVKTIDQIHREAEDEEQMTKQLASHYTGNSCMPSYGRKKMTGGAGGQKRTSKPSSEQPSSKATVAKRAKSIVGELCENKDLKEAVECVKKMKAPGMLHVFVSEAINYALENTSECRQLVGQLFHQLLQDGTLAVDRMVTGLGTVMKTAEDIEMDVPKIWDYIGELLCPPVANRTLPLGTLISTTFLFQPPHLGEGCPAHHKAAQAVCGGHFRGGGVPAVVQLQGTSAAEAWGPGGT